MAENEDLVDDALDNHRPSGIAHRLDDREPLRMVDDKAHGRRFLVYALVLIVSALFLIFFAGNPTQVTP